jgi:hypothetical protein
MAVQICFFEPEFWTSDTFTHEASGVNVGSTDDCTTMEYSPLLLMALMLSVVTLKSATVVLLSSSSLSLLHAAKLRLSISAKDSLNKFFSFTIQNV